MTIQTRKSVPSTPKGQPLDLIPDQQFQTNDPPESHPSSWFAMVSGTKRWVLHPPFDEEPPSFLSESRNACHVQSPDVRVCDQRPGEVLWLPGYWWHETCALDAFTIGIGGITYKEYEFERRDFTKPATCFGNEYEKHVYAVTDIAACGVDIECPILPHA